MTADPDATPQQWANSLTDEELAEQLRVMRVQPHKLDRDERDAVLQETAERLASRIGGVVERLADAYAAVSDMFPEHTKRGNDAK